jgi:hypothetical protein
VYSFLCFETQSQDSTLENKATTINQDPRIHELIQKRSNIEEKEEGMPGFRVQIFFGSTKQTALQTKTDYSELFKDVETYIIYDIPYFKVRVGNFRTHLEAQKLLALAKANYPSAFIVKDQIVIPELIEEKED